MLACGHPDGARMAVAEGSTVVKDGCWACMVERDQARRNAEELAERRSRGQRARYGNSRYPRRTIALGPPYDDGTIP